MQKFFVQGFHVQWNELQWALIADINQHHNTQVPVGHESREDCSAEQPEEGDLLRELGLVLARAHEVPLLHDGAAPLGPVVLPRGALAGRPRRDRPGVLGGGCHHGGGLNHRYGAVARRELEPLAVTPVVQVHRCLHRAD